MDSLQTKQLSMYEEVLAILDQNIKLWSPISTMMDMRNYLHYLILGIKWKNRKTNLSRQQILDTKEEVRKGLAQKAASVSGILQNYAEVTNHQELAHRVNVDEQELISCCETKVENMISPLIETAKGEITKLAHFDLSREMIKRLEANLTSFKSMVGLDPEVIKEVFEDNGGLEKLYAEVNDLLEVQLDPSMNQFESAEPIFFNEFKVAREAFV